MSKTHPKAEALVATLQQQGIEDSRVLDAIRRVPREDYLPEELAVAAYENRPLPIESGQTISQPYIVALMTEYCINGKREVHKILEVGTGSGYQAAILAECVEQVFSIEYFERLANHAKAVLSEHYPDKIAEGNLNLKHDDGSKGWAEHAPFDAIIVTACADVIPDALLEQLADGGRLVIPLAVEPESEYQFLHVITRQGETFNDVRMEPVRFVPLR